MNVIDFRTGEWWEDYHDAAELDAHDPAWGWMQLGCLVLAWGCVAVAVMWRLG